MPRKLHSFAKKKRSECIAPASKYTGQIEDNENRDETPILDNFLGEQFECLEQ